MEKQSKLRVAPMSLDLWYEGPALVVADKPEGMAVHPESRDTGDTLVNGLLQSNRWLAEMETSDDPGVVHRMAAMDRGLVLVAKSDEMAATLRQMYSNQEIRFSYRVRLPNAVEPAQTPKVTVIDHQIYDETTVWDIDSPVGDTGELRNLWLPNGGSSAFFVGYRINIPLTQKPIEVGLGQRVWLPSVDLYTVPPCSVCNGVKAFLTQYGFGYRDHSLDNDQVIETMRSLRGSERGIPVVLINGVVSVGFDRHRLKQALGLY